MILFLGIIPIVASLLICYFLSRAQERKTGQKRYTGKSAVIFTLLNISAWVFSVAVFLILFNLMGEHEVSSYRGRDFGMEERGFGMEERGFGMEESEGGGKDWSMFRGGLSMLICSSIAIFVLLKLWNRWVNGESYLPSDNIFVKCYSGLNMAILGTMALSFGAALLAMMLESIFGSHVGMDDDLLVQLITLLLCTIGFLVVNICVFGKCSDEPPR